MFLRLSQILSKLCVALVCAAEGASFLFLSPLRGNPLGVLSTPTHHIYTEEATAAAITMACKNLTRAQLKAASGEPIRFSVGFHKVAS